MTTEVVQENVSEVEPNKVLTSEQAPKVDSPADTKTAEAPVNYEFKFPEGFEKNEEFLSEYTEFAKENKVSPEKAQKLLDSYQKYETARIAAERKAWTDLQEKWVADVKADKEVGGPQFMEHLAVAKKAVEKYGDQSLKDLFDFTGVGNNVAMIRFLHKIGKELSEDKVHVGTQAPGTGPRDVAKLLYPTMNK